MITKKIEAKWLRQDSVRAVVRALGAENIRFVGGAVRDTLIDRAVTDIDAATLHKPDETLKLLEQAGIKAIPTGVQHGTVTAVYGGGAIEITTLRLDVETDGRHATVAFTESWLEDAKRRDFTFNALYLASDGTLYDPFGGEADLYAGKVLFIGSAEERIQEDALRILRFFRFSAHFGQGRLDEKALSACSALKHLLQNLSSERIRNELVKMVAAPAPGRALEAMEAKGIMKALGCAQVAIPELERFIAHEYDLEVSHKALIRLFLLLSPSFSAPALADWLKLSGKERAMLQSLELAMQDSFPEDRRSTRRFVYIHGVEAVSIIATLKGGAKGMRLLDVAKIWVLPRFPLRGQDLLEWGMEPGPAIGETMERLETMWVDSDFSLDKAQLMFCL